MNDRQEICAPDAEVCKAEAALRRAAHLARLVAARTRTNFIVLRDGKIVREQVPLAELDHHA